MNNNSNNNYGDRFNETNPYINNSTNDNNIYSNSNPYINTGSENDSPYHQTESYHKESEYRNVYNTSYGNNLQNLPNMNNTQPINNSVSENNNHNKEKKSRKNSHIFMKAIIAGLCFGIVAGSVMVGMNYAGSKLLNDGNSSSSSSVEKKNNNTSLKTSEGGVINTTYDVASVANNVMPSMVSINMKATRTVENPYSQFFNFGYGYGNDYKQEVQGSGSGIIISESGSELMIVTNNHVVEEADEINVVFFDESSYSATVKGTDADHDLAVVAVKLSDLTEETKKAISVATLGDSDSLQLGQPAIAIGNALGYGQSVTVGYISALDREVQTTDNTMNLIQTDAAINPGNSGGALLDISGNVIGINSAKYADTDVEGMGYAIPISVAKPIIEDLMNGRQVSDSESPYLGIAGKGVDESYSNAFDLPSGVYVSQVNNGSPAEKAGIRAGDIIAEFDGKEITTMNGLQSQIKSHKIGDKVEIVVQRQQQNGGYKKQTVTATLSSKADAGITEE